MEIGEWRCGGREEGIDLGWGTLGAFIPLGLLGFSLWGISSFDTLSYGFVVQVEHVGNLRQGGTSFSHCDAAKLLLAVLVSGKMGGPGFWRWCFLGVVGTCSLGCLGLPGWSGDCLLGRGVNR